MKKVKEENKKNTYSKESILNSKKYKEKQDLLKVLLKKEEYSLEEVDNLIDKFLKGKVN